MAHTRIEGRIMVTIASPLDLPDGLADVEDAWQSLRTAVLRAVRSWDAAHPGALVTDPEVI